MEKYHFFKNIHLQKALWLREQGKYKEALRELSFACDDNDGQAWYVKAQAYKTGGWKLSESFHSYQSSLKKSLEYGCDWGCLSLFRSKEENSELFKRVENSKDPFVITQLLLDGATIHQHISGQMDETQLAALKYTRKAFDQGNFIVACLWQKIQFFPNFMFDEKWLIECAKIRDAHAMYILRYLNRFATSFNYLEEAAKQGHMGALCIIHSKLNIKKVYGTDQSDENWLNLAKITVRLNDIEFLSKHRLEHIYLYYVLVWNRFKDIPSVPEELWIYGRWLSTLKREPSEYEIISIKMFEDTNEKVKNAIETWLIISKMFSVGKDMGKVVAQELWKSRKNPFKWKVHPRN